MHRTRFPKLRLAIGTLAISTLPGWAATPTFNAPTAFAAGTAPTAVAVGDFNGDGFADLAVTNGGYNGTTVTILLGGGNGLFKTSNSYTVGTQPLAAAVGDFNGDGKLDLVVVNYSSNSISVLLGAGNGDFQPALNYTVGKEPYAVAVGDFNGDGKLPLYNTILAILTNPTYAGVYAIIDKLRDRGQRLLQRELAEPRTPTATTGIWPPIPGLRASARRTASGNRRSLRACARSANKGLTTWMPGATGYRRGSKVELRTHLWWRDSVQV
jgi:hypothetical protein